MPSRPSEIAVLAVKSYEVFLDTPAADAEITAAIIEACRDFDRLEPSTGESRCVALIGMMTGKARHRDGRLDPAREAWAKCAGLPELVVARDPADRMPLDPRSALGLSVNCPGHREVRAAMRPPPQGNAA